jgi:ribosome-binding factor A
MPQGSENPAFRRIKNPESLAAQLREGDGIDPRLERRKNVSSRLKDKTNHAAVRLAGQIAKTIRGSLGDGSLADFDVLSVQPAKGNVFLVTLAPRTPELVYDEAQILNAANNRSGYLRSEIACSISRKKVPTLLFRVLPCPALPTNNPPEAKQYPI